MQKYVTFLHKYSEIFNNWLHKIEETGVRERIWKNWTYQAYEEFWIDEPAQLGFGNIIFIFLWILGGIFLACLVLLFEKVVHKVKARHGDKKNQPLAIQAWQQDGPSNLP